MALDDERYPAARFLVRENFDRARETLAKRAADRALVKPDTCRLVRSSSHQEDGMSTGTVAVSALAWRWVCSAWPRVHA
jgi:hypothetical protein